MIQPSSLFIRLSKSGVSLRNSKPQNRSIFLSNVIALIIGSLYLLMLLVHTLRFSIERATWILLAGVIVYGVVPYLNKKGYTNASRFVIVINTVVGLLFATLFRKFDGFTYESTFFVSRAAILILTVMLPIVLFHNRERWPLSISLFISFSVVVLLFDPIHIILGIDYYQMGHTGANYYYNNFYFFLMFVAMASIILYLKKTMEDFEEKYELSIETLSDKNLQIDRQRMELQEKNALLMEVLSKKDNDLLTVNQELIRKNNDLLQFSFAISHNVRGPVATILGLMGLIERKPTEEELKTLLGYLSHSVTSLDTILHGLNNIIESRDDTFNIKEKVDLKLELERIEKLLEPAIKQNHVSLRYKIEVDNLFTIRAYIQNILSQLIANSIQFRSPDRKPEINVLATRESGYVIIRVDDNGLGIDLHRFKEDMFKPFKRFHATSGGKGIGLYLVKLQVEKLHGTVNVISKPQKGFRITIQLSDDSYRFN